MIRFGTQFYTLLIPTCRYDIITNYMEQSPIWIAQPVTFPVFYGKRMLTAVFTRACHWRLSSVKWIQSTRFFQIPLRSIFTVFSHLRFGLPSSVFPPGSPTKIPYAFFVILVRAICPVHFILLAMITLIISGKVYKLRTSMMSEMTRVSKHVK